MGRHDRIKKIVIISVLATLIVGLAFLPIHVGPLSITLTIIPIAVGAILYGSLVGLELGFIFGLVSFLQCLGYDAFGLTLLGINPFFTILVCIPTRMLVGLLSGLFYKELSKTKLNKNVLIAITCVLVPLLNTILFMSTLCVLFYNTEFIQNIASSLNATNPFMFVIYLVGINGLVELLVGAFVTFPIVKSLQSLIEPVKNKNNDTINEKIKKNKKRTRSMKKLIMIAFALWTALVIVILSNGTGVYRKIVDKITDSIYSKTITLDDVTINKTTFSQGGTYYLDYQIHPDNYKDMGIVYTSLNETIFTVDGYSIRSIRQDKDSVTGKLLITSTLHPDFRKEVELKFNKVYATYFNLSLENFANDDNVYLGLDFTVKVSYSASEEVTEASDISILFDDTYFNVVKNGKTSLTLTPKVEGKVIGDEFEKIATNFKIMYYGEEVFSKTIYVNPMKEYTSFSKCYLSCGKELKNDIKLKVGADGWVNLFDEEILPTTYTLSSSDTNVLSVNGKTFSAKSKGTADLTVTLPSGFSKTYTIKVINNIQNISFSNKYTDDSKTYNVASDQPIFIDIYTCNEITKSFTNISYTTEHCRITKTDIVDLSGYTLNIEYKSEGTDTITITVNDEDTSYELTLTINNYKSQTSQSVISSKVRRITGKVAGHMAFFVLEAILTFFMLVYWGTRDKALDIATFITVGLFLASLTELIQFFIPGRNCSVIDIFIDFLGYTIGTILSSILYFGIITPIKRRKNKKIKKEVQENN